jgi:signal transduction histidine kinase
MKRVFFNFYFYVIASMLALQFCFAPLIEEVVERVMHEAIEHYNQELTRGVFYIMEQNLAAVPPDKWADEVAGWQPHFGFAVKLVTIDDTLALAPHKIQQLKDGLIVIDNYENEIFYRRIGTGPYALKLGAMEDLLDEGFPSGKLEAVLVMTAIGFLSIMAMVWSFPFWRKLVKIRQAAQAFGQGDFTTRAQVSRHSALAPLAEAFNHMADRIQQLIDSHRELTRAVSHELRTPVSRIRFGLEMLAGASDEDRRQQQIDGMQKDIDELDDLVSELLSYARFDGRPPGLENQAYPLVPWLKEVVAYVDLELAATHFTLQNHLQDEIVTARFDPKQMGRAVTNLLQNAAKYTRSRVELTVELVAGQVCIHVDDDGPGIPEAERKRIFEPFARLDDSRSRHSGGYGLGLAIVKRVAAWHQGTAAVEESALGGARFSICWPGIPERDKT